MFLIGNATKEKIEAVIEPVLSTDYEIIKKSGNFSVFNWEEENENEVFKIRLKNVDEILGLISLVDFKTELWLKINLLQTSEGNVGDKKKLDHIAGCLIAYACKEAFIRGYNGTVALEPKTELKKHYIEKYGMQNAGKHVYTELKNSEYLIKKYLI